MNSSPDKFEGQTIVVKAELSGSIAEEKNQIRFTVKSGSTTVSGDQLRKDGINFVAKKAEKDDLVRDVGELSGKKFSPVKLTVKVHKDNKGHWLATVSHIEPATR